MDNDPSKSGFHRRSIRYHGYDYAAEGAYFITLVTHQRECLFGSVVDGVMHPNDFGRIAREEWFKTPHLRREIHLEMDEMVVMPNHLHGIVYIVESGVTDEMKDDADDVKGDRRYGDRKGDRWYSDGKSDRMDGDGKGDRMDGDGKGDRIDGDGKGDLHFSLRSGVHRSRPVAELVRAYGHTPLPVSGFRSPSRTLGSMIRGFKIAVTTRINALRGTPGQPVWLRNYYDHIINSEREYNNIANYIADNPANWGRNDEYFG